MSESLIKQLKNLQRVEPNQSWQENTRNFLVNRVIQDTIGKPASWTASFKINSYIWYRKLLPSTSKIVTLLLIVSVIGGTKFAADAEKIPTKPLYPVKEWFESLDYLVAFTPESKAQVHLKHANTRKEEAQYLANQNIDPIIKDQQLSTVVKSLKEDISAAQNNLEIAQKTQSEPGRVAELAKDIANNANTTLNTLNQVSQSAPTNDIKKTIQDAQTTIENVQDKSLGVIINQVTKPATSASATDSAGTNINQSSNNTAVNQSVDQVLSPTELSQMINDMIARVENNNKSVGQLVNQLDLAQLIKELTANKNLADQLDITSVTGLSNSSAEVQKSLDDAKALLQQNNLSAALDKVIKGKDLYNQSNNVLQKIADLGATSTSTEMLEIKKLEQPSINGQKPVTGTKINFEDLPHLAPLGGLIMQAATNTPVETTPNVLDKSKFPGPVY